MSPACASQSAVPITLCPLTGVLSFPTTTVTSLAAAFGFAVAVSTPTTLFALLGHHLACNRWGVRTAHYSPPPPLTPFTCTGLPRASIERLAVAALYLGRSSSPSSATQVAP